MRTLIRTATCIVALAAALCAQPTVPILSVQIETPANGATVGGLVMIAGTSTDVGSGAVSISIDGGPFQLAQGTDNWTFGWDTTSVADGPHTLTARARQFIGGPAVFDSIQVTVQNAGGLGVSITSPADGALVLDTLVVVGSSFGAQAVTLLVDGQNPQPTNGLDAWTAVFEPGALEPGPHTLTAEATDGVTTVTDSVSITVGDPLPGSQQIAYVSSVDGEPLGAELYVPAGFDASAGPTALVVHLHGGGGTGNVSPTMAAELDARGWIGLAPDGRFWDLANQGCGWNTSAAYVDHPDPAVGPGEQDIFDAVDWALQSFPIDPARLYLTGFSMGGRGAYMIGLKNPDRFAAIAPMGPAIDMFEVFARRPEPCICKEGMTGGQPADGPIPQTLYRTTSGRFLIENAFNLPVFHGHGLLDSVASNDPANAPFLHGWHIVSDPSWNGAHTTPATNAQWGNSCFTGPDSDLPLSFGFGHTPTLSELNARHPDGYDWAFMFTPVGHSTDPLWLQGQPITPGSFGTVDPLNPGSWIGIYEFFERHTLATNPDTVVFKTYEDEHEAAYWATIVSAVPWQGVPAAVRATRDVAQNRLDVELSRAAEVRFDVDGAGLSLAPGQPLSVALARLAEPVYDPALDSVGEALTPLVVLDGDFANLADVTVMQDGALLPAGLVAFDASQIAIGPIDASAPTSLAVFAAETYCTALPNSTGLVASIDASGTASLSANSLVLSVAGAVPLTNGLFFYGMQRTQLPFGNGVLCMQPPLARLAPPQQANALGQVARPLDFTQPPAGGGPAQIQPGSVWAFQYWYRDPAAGGASFNTSNAVEIEFVP